MFQTHSKRHTTAKHQLKIVSTFYYHCNYFLSFFLAVVAVEDEQSCLKITQSERQKNFEIGIEIENSRKMACIAIINDEKYVSTERWVMALSAQLFSMK